MAVDDIKGVQEKAALKKEALQVMYTPSYLLIHDITISVHTHTHQLTHTQTHTHMQATVTINAHTMYGG